MLLLETVTAERQQYVLFSQISIPLLSFSPYGVIKTSFPTLFFHIPSWHLPSTFYTLPLPRPLRNGALFPRSSYIRPGTQLFCPTTNSVYLSEHHSVMKGIENSTGNLGHLCLQSLHLETQQKLWSSFVPSLASCAMLVS